MSSFASSFLDSVGVALMISCAMWGMTTLQTISYYRNFRIDHIALKVSVGMIWAFYTTYVACMVAGVRDMMAAMGPDDGTLPDVINTGAFFATFTQCSVQTIYALRIYRLSKKPFILAIVCWITILYNLIAGIIYNVIFYNRPPDAFIQLEKRFNWLLVSWYGATGAVDVMITVTLCYKLLKMRRSNDMNNTQRSSDILDVVVLWTVQTGMITSILAVTIVVLYCTVASPGPWISLTPIITSVYALSLVTLLNGRSILLRNSPTQSDATTVNTLTTPDFAGMSCGGSEQIDMYNLKQLDNPC